MRWQNIYFLQCTVTHFQLVHLPCKLFIALLDQILSCKVSVCFKILWCFTIKHFLFLSKTFLVLLLYFHFWRKFIRDDNFFATSMDEFQSSISKIAVSCLWAKTMTFPALPSTQEDGRPMVPNRKVTGLPTEDDKWHMVIPKSSQWFRLLRNLSQIKKQINEFSYKNTTRKTK